MHDNRRVRPSRSTAVRLAAAGIVAALALGGCSSSDPAPEPEPTPSASLPAGFKLPAGVTLTPGGTTLTVGRPATVVHQVGDGAASAVTVAVSGIEPGSMDDFRFFSIDEETKKSAPYYVTVTVTNDGPAGLGGAALPIFARDSTNTHLPANDIVGTFKPCPTATLPQTFLPAATATLCLVYLVPAGRTLESIVLQTGTAADAVSWKP
ncbi:MAG: hypothetical protein JWR55_3254 [Aeromicrobium sp.]|nr:hypothetical protein [Aeromicrobium sp.]